MLIVAENYALWALKMFKMLHKLPSAMLPFNYGPFSKKLVKPQVRVKLEISSYMP